MTGVTVERTYVDLGYRGHNYKGKAEVYLPRDRSVTSPAIKEERRRRSAIEPIIGHLKSDGLLERNHLKGTDGDAINAILCAIGHNMRLLAAWLKVFWRALFLWRTSTSSSSPLHSLRDPPVKTGARQIRASSAKRVVHGRLSRLSPIVTEILGSVLQASHQSSSNRTICVPADLLEISGHCIGG